MIHALGIAGGLLVVCVVVVGAGVWFVFEIIGGEERA